MTPVLLTQAALIDALTDWIAGGLDGAEVHLFQNSILFDPTTTLIGDLDEANYGGYAAIAAVFGVPSVSDDGNVESILTAQVWRPTNSTTPNTIYGWYLTADGGALLAGGTFDTGGLPMNSALDVINTVIRLRLDSTGSVSIVS